MICVLRTGYMWYVCCKIGIRDMCVTNWVYMICVSRTGYMWYVCRELGICDMCVTNSTIIYSLDICGYHLLSLIYSLYMCLDMCVTNWVYVICVSRTRYLWYVCDQLYYHLLSIYVWASSPLSHLLSIYVWVSRYVCHELAICDMCVTN